MTARWFTRRHRQTRYAKRLFGLRRLKMQKNKQNLSSMLWVHKVLFNAVQTMKRRKMRIMVDFAHYNNDQYTRKLLKRMLGKWDRRILYATFLLKRIAMDILNTDALGNSVTQHLSLGR